MASNQNPNHKTENMFVFMLHNIKVLDSLTIFRDFSDSILQIFLASIIGERSEYSTVFLEKNVHQEPFHFSYFFSISL